MQSYRITTRALPTRIIKSASTKPATTKATLNNIMPAYCQPRASYHPMASFFPRFPAQEFAPLFRLLDEDVFNPASSTNNNTTSASRSLRSFQPRFDVREETDAFHLQGELPGIEQKDIQIEFVDQNTLVVHGRTVRESSSSSSSPEPTNAQAIEDAAETDAELIDKDDASSTTSTTNYQKASVEDEGAEGAAAAATATTGAEVAKMAPAEEKTVQKAPEAPKSKYWVSERSVGQFHRSFAFPGHLDQDRVTASLKNGILDIVVPKAQVKEPRRIAVQ